MKDRVKTKTSTMAATYKSEGRQQTDKGPIWHFKVFHLFPLLVRCVYLDHIFRLVFPIVYTIYMLIALSEVDFGSPHFALLETARCYREALL